MFESLKLIMTPGQEANGDNQEILFDLLDNNGMLSDMLSVCIRIPSMRHTTYNYMIK